jgi:hypothetical protein
MARLLRDMDEFETWQYFNSLAQATRSILPQDAGKFLLLVFDDAGMCQYVTNTNRSHAIMALRETADRLEANEDITR